MRKCDTKYLFKIIHCKTLQWSLNKRHLHIVLIEKPNIFKARNKHFFITDSNRESNTDVMVCWADQN